ncbi:hypothetical protein MTO96_013026 [Rhipicephalus appendiculatus]
MSVAAPLVPPAAAIAPFFGTHGPRFSLSLCRVPSLPRESSYTAVRAAAAARHALVVLPRRTPLHSRLGEVVANLLGTSAPASGGGLASLHDDGESGAAVSVSL